MPKASKWRSERDVRDPMRRQILRAMPALPLAGLGLMRPAEASTCIVNEAPGDKREPLYRETELIARYYQRARF